MSTLDSVIPANPMPNAVRPAEASSLDLEEAILLAEIGEYLIGACGFSAGNGYDEPREMSISWEWQQSAPHQYGLGTLLAESTKWHGELAKDGILTEASKLRTALSARSTPAKEGE